MPAFAGKTLSPHQFSIDFLHEFPYSSYNCFPSLEETGIDEFTLKDKKNMIPLMYSIKGTYMPELIHNNSATSATSKKATPWFKITNGLIDNVEVQI